MRHRNRILRGIEYLLWILCAGQVLNLGMDAFHADNVFLAIC
jgi:hypothetical protein